MGCPSWLRTFETTPRALSVSESASAWLKFADKIPSFWVQSVWIGVQKLAFLLGLLIVLILLIGGTNFSEKLR